MDHIIDKHTTCILNVLLYDNVGNIPTHILEIKSYRLTHIFRYNMNCEKLFLKIDNKCHLLFSNSKDNLYQNAKFFI